MTGSSRLVGLLVVLAISAAGAPAQPITPAPAAAAPIAPAAAAAPATAPADGRWDEISDRVVFLTTTLATVETSLHAVDMQIRQTGYQAQSKVDAADRARRGNELMNRNLGMPTSIDWKTFYGRTAQRFFYHPRGGNTYYLNPPPIADRPPQFDYIYKANQQAKRQADADAAALGGKLDALLKRRAELETKQVALWAQIPFEAVAYQDVTEKPLYRFELKAAGSGPIDQQHRAAVAAGAAFVRDANDLMTATTNTITRDPQSAIAHLRDGTAAAAKRAQDALLKQDQLSAELSAPDHPLQQLAAAIKRAAAVSRNLADASQLATESAAAGDEPAKAQYRAVMPNALLEYASVVMAADQSLEQLSHDWKVQPDPQRELADTAASSAAATTAGSARAYPADAAAFNGHHYKYFAEPVDWNVADQRCKEMGGFLAWPPTDSAAKFLHQLKGKNNVAWLSGYRTKDGWRTVADGHPIRASRLHVKPVDQAIVLTSDGHLDGRPFSGEVPTAKVKMVTGFICQWDE